MVDHTMKDMDQIAQKVQQSVQDSLNTPPPMDEAVSIPKQGGQAQGGGQGQGGQARTTKNGQHSTESMRGESLGQNQSQEQGIAQGVGGTLLTMALEIGARAFGKTSPQQAPNGIQPPAQSHAPAAPAKEAHAPVSGMNKDALAQAASLGQGLKGMGAGKMQAAETVRAGAAVSADMPKGKGHSM